MPSSGTFTYQPPLAELFDEVIETAGINPSVTGTTHIKSFCRSLRLMLNSEWSTLGIRNWMVAEEIAHTVAVGENFFLLAVGDIDIVEAVLRRPGAGLTANPTDTEMYAITRNEYLTIANKNDQGRPDRYWVERLVRPKVHYWQAGSNTTDQIVYNVFRQNQDVSGSLNDTLGIPTIAYDALTAGMAARMALKWNPQKYQLLQSIYMGDGNPIDPKGKLGALRAEDRERGDIDLYAAIEPRTGRK